MTSNPSLERTVTEGFAALRPPLGANVMPQPKTVRLALASPRGDSPCQYYSVAVPFSMPDRWTGIEFIYTPSFERSARGLLDDESMRRVEHALVTEPRAGAVVAGAGGIRKVRVALPGRGKRGSARVAYLYVEVRGRIYFLLAYAKGDQVDLTAADKKLLRQLVRELEANK